VIELVFVGLGHARHDMHDMSASHGTDGAD
jgi:hypothetical protein